VVDGTVKKRPRKTPKGGASPVIRGYPSEAGSRKDLHELQRGEGREKFACIGGELGD